MDVHLREEAPSHGSSSSAGGGVAGPPLQPSASAVSSTGVPVSSLEAALDEEGMHMGGRGLVDDQRSGYGFAAEDGGQSPSSSATTGYPLQGSSYTMGPMGTDVKSELPAPSAMPPTAAHVPLQPRPAYAPFIGQQPPSGSGGSGGSGGGMGVPLRPASSGKARSNSWSYPASAVAPYTYPSPAASSAGGGAGAGGSGGGTGMPAPRPSRYRSRTSSLSFSSPEDAMRQQYLEQQQQQQQQQQTPMFLSYPPQPSQPQQRQDQYSTMFGTTDDGGGFLAAYQQSRPPQAAAPSTPPLPTTPSSFIRRTSLPQTYLHTIPISRSTPGFTPASTDTALPINLPQTAEVPQKLEIPTHGARALPKEIATHPAIQSITKTHSDSTPVGEEATGEKEGGVEVKGEEEEETGVMPAEGKFVDISEYLNLPQSKVAKTLGIPSSTLSKRWKEAARARKWPWRTVCKIDKEIMALLSNIPKAVAAKGPEHVPPEIHSRLLTLLKQRQDELKPVIIRLS